jgi:lipid-A-disaccharide synthase
MIKDVYLIAGEASGDFIGAQLMRSLKAQNPEIVFSGIGGPLMKEQGLNSLFPMEELSVMGVAEILPRLFKLIGRIKETVTDIIAKEPDMVVTIDAPDFSFRVQKKVRSKMTNPPKLVHYVAPTVWAWREHRALKVSKFLDGMICLFDFEPPYFEKVGLKAIAVGHPMMESGILESKPALIGDENTIKLGLFLGSRKGELKHTAPILIQAVQKIISQNKNIELIVPTLPHLEMTVTEMLAILDVPMTISTNQDDKWSLFKACDGAVAVSGTVGLELAVSNVPHLIAYRASPLTVFIIRRLIKTRFVHLANIILHKQVIPELLQEDCTVANVAEKIIQILRDKNIREMQQIEFGKVRQKLGEESKPSDKAAQFLLSFG